MRDFALMQASKFTSSPSPVLRTSSPVPGVESHVMFLVFARMGTRPLSPIPSAKCFRWFNSNSQNGPRRSPRRHHRLKSSKRKAELNRRFFRPPLRLANRLGLFRLIARKPCRRHPARNIKPEVNEQLLGHAQRMIVIGLRPRLTPSLAHPTVRGVFARAPRQLHSSLVSLDPHESRPLNFG